MAVSSDRSMYTRMSVGEYIATRFTSLRPPLNTTPNPITSLRKLNRRHWQFVMVAWLGWMWDAFDFFSVALTATDIAKSLDVSLTDVTWGITLVILLIQMQALPEHTAHSVEQVLMLRSVGSITFGIAADRWGRRWPFVINLVLFIVFAGFVNILPRSALQLLSADLSQSLLTQFLPLFWKCE